MFFYYINRNSYSGGRIIWQKTLHWQEVWQKSWSHPIRKAVLKFQAGGGPITERGVPLQKGGVSIPIPYRYITYNYLKKKLTLTIIITTPTINLFYIDEIIELKADTDLGKVPI